MVRSVAKKVMWVGRATVFLVGLAVILALIFGVLSRATAHSGSPGLFHLNHNNPVTALSTLTGTLADSVLKVDNNGAGPALSLEAGIDKAPLTVNSDAGTATNLSADKLDGKNSTDFWSGVTYTKTQIFSGQPDQFTDASLSCDGSGDVLLSGGYQFFSNAGYTVTTDTVNNGIYYLTWYTPSNYGGQQVRVYIYCADFGTPQ
jgi:hypothetical protein